jgi:hypothetical protein
MKMGPGIGVCGVENGEISERNERRKAVSNSMA